MLQIKKQVELKSLNTFNVSAKASDFIQIDSIESLLQAIPQIKRYSKKLVLGGGSNILFTQDYSGLIIYPQLFGIELLSESESHYLISVGASENWHQWVVYSNKRGWFGLENLALIPGTVGAAPVQNIGAYGVEVKQFIQRVECVDLDTGEIVVFENEDCQFAYRESVFKQAGKDKFLVTRVEFQLNKQPALCLDYQPLANLLKDNGNITAEQVVHSVCRIRQEKLPDPGELANAGSFFKNPVISNKHFEKLKINYPDIVAYPTATGTKLAAGWLIDKAGYKGMRCGDVGVHRFQALVLVNYAESDGQKICLLAQQIQKDIWDKYEVWLEPEVRIEGEMSLSKELNIENVHE